MAAPFLSLLQPIIGIEDNVYVLHIWSDKTT